MNARVLLLLLLPVLTGCSQDVEPQAAARTFAAFQTALQQRDEAACRQLLTLESQQVLSSMPWEAVAKKEPLRIVGATRLHQSNHAFRVEVQDPNTGHKAGQFIVVREYGQLVVDLVASAGLNAQVVKATGGNSHLEPRQLTPADHEKIREYQLSQPPR